MWAHKGFLFKTVQLSLLELHGINILFIFAGNAIANKSNTNKSNFIPGASHGNEVHFGLVFL